MNLKKHSILYIAALVLAGTSMAQAMDVRQEVDLFLQQRFIDSDKLGYKFEEYRAVPNGLVIDRYNLESDSEQYDFSIEALHIKELDQSYRIEGGKPGVFGYKLSWNQTPHLYSYDARTLYVPGGNGILRLSDEIQRDFQNDPGRFVAVSSGVASFLTGAHNVPLLMQNEKAGLNLSYHLLPDLVLDIDGSRVHRYGSRALGASFGFSQMVEVPEPIDDITYETGLGLNYTKKNYQAAFKYDYSLFDNNNPILIWDSFKRLTDRYTSASGYSSADQSSQGRMALPPSNNAHNFKFSLGADLPAKTRFSADVGYSIWSQNEPMLPYTINSAINSSVNLSGTANDPPFDASNPANLPNGAGTTVDAKLNVLSHAYKLSSRLGKSLRANLGFRSYEITDKGRKFTFPGQAPFDQIWRNETLENEHFNYKKDNLEAKFDYDFSFPVSLGLVVGREWVDREREVEKSKEDQVALSAQWRPDPKFFVNASYLLGFRRMDEFNDEHYRVSPGSTTFIELPGLRRFDVGDRDREQGRIQVQYNPSDASIGLSARMTNDDFKPGKGDLTGGISTNQNKMYGMLKQKEYAFGGDLSLPLSEDSDVDVYYEYDIGKRDVLSNYNNTSLVNQDAANDWGVRAEETSHIGGLALSNQVTSDLKAAIGYDISYSLFDLDTFGIASGGNISAADKPSLPQTKRVMQDVFLRAVYKLTENLKLTGRYNMQRFDVTDFAVENLPLAGGKTSSGASSTNSIYLGASENDYLVHVVALGLTYSF